MKEEYEGIPIREFLLPICAVAFFVGCLIFVFVTSCSRCSTSVYEKPIFDTDIKVNEMPPEMLKQHLESDVPKG